MARLTRGYTPLVAIEDDVGKDGGEPEDQPFTYDDVFAEDDDEEVEEPPPSLRASVADAATGLAALLAISVAVFLLYIAGGMFLGFLTWAAPAVVILAAAFLLARYLSKNR